MVFKLVPVDGQNLGKIELVMGTHVIGRGKLLHVDDNDKRVSRNHAELIVTGDIISLKSLHQNPCFYTKKNCADTEILHQNNTIFLNNGDKFGLLPDHFWYEVIKFLDSGLEVPVSKEKTSKEQSDVSSKKNTLEEPIDFPVHEEVVKLERSDSPSLLNGNSTTDATQPYNLNDPSTCSAPSTPNKRGHDSLESSPVDNKRVKMEADSPDPQPGPSRDKPIDKDVSGGDVNQKPNVNAPASPAKPNVDAPTSPAKPSAPLRERCMYGANCYRRNPQHKAQFSHPSDQDWGPGDRGVCPYGAACRRIDPRHWQNHEHPPGVHPPQPNARRPGFQVVHRQGNVFYINAHAVNFYDDHFQVEDSDGDSVDFDYEF